MFGLYGDGCCDDGWVDDGGGRSYSICDAFLFKFHLYLYNFFRFCCLLLSLLFILFLLLFVSHIEHYSEMTIFYAWAVCY